MSKSTASVHGCVHGDGARQAVLSAAEISKRRSGSIQATRGAWFWRLEGISKEFDNGRPAEELQAADVRPIPAGKQHGMGEK